MLIAKHPTVKNPPWLAQGPVIPETPPFSGVAQGLTPARAAAPPAGAAPRGSPGIEAQDLAAVPPAGAAPPRPWPLARPPAPAFPRKREGRGFSLDIKRLV